MSTILANQSTLGYNVASTGAYTLINGLKEISTPKPEWAVTDVSSLTDTTVQRLPGFVDNKAFGWTMLHTAANKALLTTLSGLVFYYQISLSDSSTFTMQAILKSWSSKLARNGEVTYVCEAEITGAVTIA